MYCRGRQRPKARKRDWPRTSRARRRLSAAPSAAACPGAPISSPPTRTPRADRARDAGAGNPRPSSRRRRNGRAKRVPRGLRGIDHDGVPAAALVQSAAQALMAPAVERRGDRLQRPPHRAMRRRPSRRCILLSPALAQHARHLAAGDDLGARRQQIFEQRAAAMAIAADIDELGHVGPVGAIVARREAGRLCHFRRQSTSSSAEVERRPSAMLSRHLGNLAGLA